MEDWPYDASFDGIQILATEPIEDSEALAYRQRGLERYPDLYCVKCKIDGDYVDLEYCHGELVYTPFQRIRRITGYLVGTLDRWNDGKKAEERDRVKHA